MTPMDIDVASFAAAFLRSIAFLYAAPVVGERATPPRIRGAAAVLFALAISSVRKVDPAAAWAVLPGEILLGLAVGFAARLALSGADAGGQLVGMQLGLGFAGTFDPAVAEEALPTRRIASTVAGLAFLEAGGLESSLHALATPVVSGNTAVAIFASLIDRGGAVMVAGVRLVAPMMIAAVVGNVAAAVASRAVPALNVYSVALALVLAIGGIALIGTAPAFSRDLWAIGQDAANAVATVTAAAPASVRP